MSSGKFSQPRPHRDEERQIEESFRQLTEESPRRRKKIYNVEEDIRQTVRDITAEEVSLPREDGLPFEKSAKLEQTVQAAPRHTASANPPIPPRQPVRSAQETKYDLLPEDVDAFFESSELPPEEPATEQAPDFIDKVMQLGTWFQKHQTPVILGLCGAAVLLIILFVSIFFTGGKQEDPYGDLILPNVRIADVNVGGMSKNEAISTLKAATGNTYTQQDMVIDLSGTEIRLSPKDTKAELDVNAAVEAAYEYGRTGTQAQQEQIYQNALVEEHVIAALPYLQLDLQYIRDELNAYAEDSGSTLTQTSYGLEGDEPKLSAEEFSEKAPTQTLVIIMGTPGIGFDVNDVYEKVLDAYSLHQFLVEVDNVQSITEPDAIDMEAIYKEFYIAPVNASVNMQDYKTEPGSYGYGFDLEAAVKLVANAQHGEVLRIPMEYIAPEVLDNDAFFKDALGSHQTRGTGNDERNKNLLLACKAINDTVLNPGETMSFSSMMSKVSGWRTAPEDAGMEEVAQGGVSQVASTLYYAALMADLDISARSAHSYVPSFIDLGLDATAGLKIRNTTGYPVRINAEYSGGFVKVEILGTEERKYYVMLESSIASSTAVKTIYEDFEYENAEGYEDGDVIREGSTGYLVKSYKVKYSRNDGKELSRDFITNTQYPAVDRIIARVEKPTEPPTEAPTETPTVPPTTVPPTTVPPTEAPTQPPETTQATQPSEEAAAVTESQEVPQAVVPEESQQAA